MPMIITIAALSLAAQLVQPPPRTDSLDQQLSSYAADIRVSENDRRPGGGRTPDDGNSLLQAANSRSAIRRDLGLARGAKRQGVRRSSATRHLVVNPLPIGFRRHRSLVESGHPYVGDRAAQAVHARYRAASHAKGRADLRSHGESLSARWICHRTERLGLRRPCCGRAGRRGAKLGGMLVKRPH